MTSLLIVIEPFNFISHMMHTTSFFKLSILHPTISPQNQNSFRYLW